MTNPIRQDEYMAFISYRHADNKEEDRQWATWLHKQLEVYDIPAELIGTKNMRGEIIPERIYPVFRDEVSLPANADLSSTINRALDDSRFLVVLCSPRAVQSTYLCREIIHFKASGKSDRVIAALLLGEPNASIDSAKHEDPEDARTLECFPQPLQYEVERNGELFLNRPSEPLAADFRLPDGGKGLTNPSMYKQHLLNTGHHDAKQAERLALAYEEKLSIAKLKIIAGILGVRLDTLTERDKVHQLTKERQRSYQARKIGALMAALAVVAVVGALFASWQYIEAENERSRAEELLSSTRMNLTFMNFELREVLDRYVPTGPRVDITERIDGIVDTLEAHGSSDDIYSIAVAKAQKSDLILTENSQNPALALPLLKEAHEGFKELVEQDPGNIRFQRDLSVSYDRLGNIAVSLGNTDAALINYNRALEVRVKLVEQDPDHLQFQRDVSVSYEKLGNLAVSLGNTDAALDNFNQALNGLLKLVEQNPSNPQFQHDVSISYNKLGDVELRLGNTNAALINYTQALEVLLKLVDRDPGNTQLQRDMSVAYGSLGDIELRLGNTDAALDNYNQAHEGFKELVEQDPGNIQFQRDISVSYEKLGDIELRRGNTDAALIIYTQALEVLLKLVDRDPGNTQLQRDLSISYEKLGDLELRRGDTDAALVNYEKFLEFALKLVEREPGNTQFQRNIAVSNAKLGSLYQAEINNEQAMLFFQSALDKVLEMAAAGILADDDSWMVPYLKEQIDNGR